MLYSKNGSIPKTETDGTEGWIEVEVAPTPGPNQEVVWWYPPGWVVRPVCPNEPGMVYNWSQSEQQWVASPAPVVDGGSETLDLTSSGDTGTITMNSASSTIEIQTLSSSSTL